MTERTERCENCLFWDKWDGVDQGRCRRYPPVLMTLKAMAQVVDDEDIYSGRYPETDTFDWCGEFQPKPIPRRALLHCGCPKCNSIILLFAEQPQTFDLNRPPPANCEACGWHGAYANLLSREMVQNDDGTWELFDNTRIPDAVSP
jgi:hypothetical protein